MTQTPAGSFERNLKFTTSAASWVVALSILAILKPVVLMLIPATPAVAFFLPPLLQLIPAIYFCTFVYFFATGSQYASVSFSRGIANLFAGMFFRIGALVAPASWSPYLLQLFCESIPSLVLILYVLGSERIDSSVYASPLRIETPKPVWKAREAPQFESFTVPLTITFFLLLAGVFCGVPLALLNDSSARAGNSVGVIVFVFSLIAAPLHLIGVLIFALRGQGQYALGCALCVFLLGFTGFFGCAAALSGGF